MEEQALLLRENLLNIRSVLVTNRKKINKLRYKQSVVEKNNSRRKKIRMREKIMETPKNIGKSLKGVGDSAVKGAKKSGLGNALGLLAIIAIGSNIESIKKLYSDFIKGETFKNIAEGFQNTIDFFKNLFNGFKTITNLLGESYDNFIAFKDASIEKLEEVTQTFKDLQEKFEELNRFAADMKEKFDNLLQGSQDVKIGEEKEKLKEFGFTDEDLELEKSDNNPFQAGNMFTGFPDKLGLTDYDNLDLNSNMFDLNNDDFIPIDFEGIDPPFFDYSQYNDDETNKEITVITKTNTVIT